MKKAIKNRYQNHSITNVFRLCTRSIHGLHNMHNLARKGRERERTV